MAKKAKKAKKTKAKARYPKKTGPAKKARYPKKTRPAKKAKPAKKKTVAKTKKPLPRPKPAPNDAGLAIVSVEAIADLKPLPPFRFRVHSRIEAPTPGFTAFLQPAVPQGFNPAILILDVVLVRKSGGGVPQVITEIDADYEDKNYKGKFTDVTVRYGKVSKSAKVQIVV